MSSARCTASCSRSCRWTHWSRSTTSPASWQAGASWTRCWRSANSALRTSSISHGCRRATSWSPTKRRCPICLVRPTSTRSATTSYNFMQQPLLSGDVWIGFDHVARVLDALRQKPDEFVAFPAPAGPKGRGYMPVLAGLAVLKSAADMSGAMALIDYLTQPQTQIVTARSVGFFPVVKAELPPDFEPGLKLAAVAIEKMESAKDALPALLPVGLG